MTPCARAAGPAAAAEDQRVVGAFAAQAAVILERHRLSEAAAAAVPIAEGDRMRTALLRPSGTTCAPRWPRRRRR